MSKFVIVSAYSFEEAMSEAKSLIKELAESGVKPKEFYHTDEFPIVNFEHVSVKWLDCRKSIYGRAWRCDEAFGFSKAAREYLTHRKEGHFEGDLAEYILLNEGFEG